MKLRSSLDPPDHLDHDDAVLLVVPSTPPTTLNATSAVVTIVAAHVIANDPAFAVAAAATGVVFDINRQEELTYVPENQEDVLK